MTDITYDEIGAAVAESGNREAIANWDAMSDQERQQVAAYLVLEFGGVGPRGATPEYVAEVVSAEDDAWMDMSLISASTPEKLAEYAVDEGWFGDVPSNLSYYIDYAALGRDLEHDYTKVNIDGDDFYVEGY